MTKSGGIIVYYLNPRGGPCDSVTLQAHDLKGVISYEHEASVRTGVIDNADLLVIPPEQHGDDWAVAAKTALKARSRQAGASTE